ncbi:hypothetical protein GYMLUDRAFT_60455 [Collybiopsis luxurians FD-317 M1]|uniref:Uncharacterized protein n=1 Tax=Collybiopsis luxurians FD-317 M1 TaxID=944289 RepID=A0A0D0B6E1_9AGAR|nr:hypothetical protein GYMLUDRAFT_60455 [Collybiopsis luxurians FD-317 M1]
MVQAVLCSMNDNNPFTGNLSDKMKAWNQVYQCYLDKGGNQSRDAEWLKKKVNECIDQHDNLSTLMVQQSMVQEKDIAENQGNPTQKKKSLRKITSLVCSNVSKNHIILASILEAIGHQRSKSHLESAEQGVKHHQIEATKTAKGKEIVAASLISCHQALVQCNSSINTTNVKVKELEDDILVMDNNSLFQPIAMETKQVNDSQNIKLPS